MRESRRYLLWMPVKFAAGLGILYLALLALFSFIEHRAAAHGPIYGDLPFYIFLLAALPATSGLLAMAENYLAIWSSEVSLERYLRKLGVESS